MLTNVLGGLNEIRSPAAMDFHHFGSPATATSKHRRVYLEPGWIDVRRVAPHRAVVHDASLQNVPSSNCIAAHDRSPRILREVIAIGMAKPESVSYFMRYRACAVFKVVNNHPPTGVVIVIGVIPHAGK